MGGVNWQELEQTIQGQLKGLPHGGKKDVATALHITRTHLSQLISGKRPMTREIAEALAGQLGLRLEFELRRQE